MVSCSDTHNRFGKVVENCNIKVQTPQMMLSYCKQLPLLVNDKSEQYTVCINAFGYKAYFKAFVDSDGKLHILVDRKLPLQRW